MSRLLFNSVITVEQLNYLGRDRINYVLDKSSRHNESIKKDLNKLGELQYRFGHIAKCKGNPINGDTNGVVIDNPRKMAESRALQYYRISNDLNFTEKNLYMAEMLYFDNEVIETLKDEGITLDDVKKYVKRVSLLKSLNESQREKLIYSGAFKEIEDITCRRYYSNLPHILLNKIISMYVRCPYVFEEEKVKIK